MKRFIFKGEKLKQRRTELGLTLRALATTTDITPPGLNRIERGERSPTAESLGRIAAALKVTPNYFFEKE